MDMAKDFRYLDELIHSGADEIFLDDDIVLGPEEEEKYRNGIDIDMDFIRYSISDDAIDEFLSKLNCLGRITIERTGKITKLKQQDYHYLHFHLSSI